MNPSSRFPTVRAGQSLLCVKNTARKSLKPSITNNEIPNAGASVITRSNDTLGTMHFIQTNPIPKQDTSNFAASNGMVHWVPTECNPNVSTECIKQNGDVEETQFPSLAIGPVWSLAQDTWDNFELNNTQDNIDGLKTNSPQNVSTNFKTPSQERFVGTSNTPSSSHMPLNSHENRSISSKPSGLLSRLGQTPLTEEGDIDCFEAENTTVSNLGEHEASIEELRKQLRIDNGVKIQLKSMLVDMRKEKEILRSKITELQKENAQLVSALKEMQKDKVSLEKSKTREIERRLEISKEYQIIVAQKNNMLAQSNNLQMMYGVMQDERNKLKCSRDKLQQDLDECNGSKATTAKELKDMALKYEKQVAKHQNVVKDFKKTKSELEEKIKHLKKENKELQDNKEQEILAFQKDYEQMKTLMIGDMETEKVMLAEEVEKLRSENNQLKEQCGKLQISVDELQKEMDEMKHLMEIKSKALEEKSKQFRAQVSALEEANAELEKKIKDGEEDNSSCKASMEVKIKDMEEIVKQFQVQINCLEKEKNNLKKQKEERRKEIKELQLSLKSAEDKNAQFEQLILVLQKLNNTLEKHMQERQQQITDLEHYIKNKVSEMDEKSKQCQSEMALLHSDIEKSKKVEESLRADIFQLVRKRDEITRLNNVLKFEKENLAQQCSHLQQEVQQLKARIDTLNNSGPKDHFAMQKLIEALQLKISVLKLEYYKNCRVQHNESNFVHVSNSINYSYHNGSPRDPRCGANQSTTAVVSYEDRAEMNSGDRNSVEHYNSKRDIMVKKLKTVLESCDSKDMFRNVIDIFRKHADISESDFAHYSNIQSKESSSSSYSDYSADDRVLSLKNKKLLSDLTSMERENEKLENSVDRLSRSNESLKRSLQKTSKEHSILKEKFLKMTSELDELRKVKKVYVHVTKPADK